jgi:cell wall assembly regulator SMI1
MKFENSAGSLTESDIARAEADLGFKLPPAVRNFYLTTNGGQPDPYVFESLRIGLAVNFVYPLIAEKKDTALIAYDIFVRLQKAVPPSFLPFAVDDDGNHLFVDCSKPDGPVFSYAADPGSFEKLISLDVGFDAFFASLKVEE